MDKYEDLSRSRDFLTFLKHVQSKGSEAEKTAATTVINNIKDAVDYINNKEGITTNKYDSSRYLIQYTEQIKLFKTRARKLQSHTRNVERAYRHIKKHNK